MEAIISYELVFLDITEPVVTIESYWFTPREPTYVGLHCCPERFRCFICQRMRSKKRWFAGEVQGQRLCKACFPYVDEMAVAAFIHLEERKKFPACKNRVSLASDIWTGLVLVEEK